MKLIKSFKYKIQNFSTYFITWFFPKGRGKLFWKVYVYFRWVDDIVDDMNISQGYKRKFLKQQRMFLDSVYGKRKINTNKLNYEEKGIYDVIILNKASKEFKEHIYNMMWTFDFDIKRVGIKVQEKDLMKYSRYLGYAYAFMFMEFFDVISYYEKRYNKLMVKLHGKNVRELAMDYAHYCHLIHILRDYKKDKKEKLYDNIPLGTDYLTFKNKIVNIVRPKFEYLHNNVFSSIKILSLRYTMLFIYNKFNNSLNKL
ncbi:MAG: squalene/phytoene synthase family protein [Candidatus Woesearchaeota archaeon]